MSTMKIMREERGVPRAPARQQAPCQYPVMYPDEGRTATSLHFERSSYCYEGGCVEVAAAPLEFVTSSFSTGLAACVEVSPLPNSNGVAIRDTKLKGAGPTLGFSREDFERLRVLAKADELAYDGLPLVALVFGCIRLSRSVEGMVLVAECHRPEDMLHFTELEWEAFIKGLQNDEFAQP